MAVAFGRGCGFASGRLLGATGPRMESYNWKATPISPCLGAHEAHPKRYFAWGCFPKIEWAPAYVGTAIAAWVESGVAGPPKLLIFRCRDCSKTPYLKLAELAGAD